MDFGRKLDEGTQTNSYALDTVADERSEFKGAY